MDKQTRLLVYLTQELAYKRHRAAALGSGHATLEMTTNGDTRDVTSQEVEKLKDDIADIEKILADQGYVEG